MSDLVDAVNNLSLVIALNGMAVVVMLILIAWRQR
jgi:hypothetical protein